MKIIIEYDNEQEAIQALNAERWQGAMWQLDQWMRGIVKHGYIDNREATECEIECYSNCRDILRQLMDNNEVTFHL